MNERINGRGYPGYESLLGLVIRTTGQVHAKQQSPRVKQRCKRISVLYKASAIYLIHRSFSWNARVVELVDTHV